MTDSPYHAKDDKEIINIIAEVVKSAKKAVGVFVINDKDHQKIFNEKEIYQALRRKSREENFNVLAFQSLQEMEIKGRSIVVVDTDRILILSPRNEDGQLSYLFSINDPDIIFPVKDFLGRLQGRKSSVSR